MWFGSAERPCKISLTLKYYVVIFQIFPHFWIVFKRVHFFHVKPSCKTLKCICVWPGTKHLFFSPKVVFVRVKAYLTMSWNMMYASGFPQILGGVIQTLISLEFKIEQHIKLAVKSKPNLSWSPSLKHSIPVKELFFCMSYPEFHSLVTDWNIL